MEFISNNNLYFFHADPWGREQAGASPRSGLFPGLTK